MSTTETLDIGHKRASLDQHDAGLVTLFSPSPESTPSAIRLGEDAIVLGREVPSGGIALPFAGVSRLHCRVVRRGGEIHVEDLDSRNGTFINGRRTRKAIVDDDDEIRIGEVLFKAVTTNAQHYERWPLAGIVPPAPQSNLRGGFVMERVRSEITRMARAPLSVLILGETGTGKEVVARALHDASGRRGKFCAVNCAAIPSALLESELFGYKRGAFTGADRDRLGLVRSAEGGTLFLDEIGDMPLDAQAKILRMLETRQVMPVGGHVAEPVDVRVVCATHRELPRLVREERFRADLLARIAGHSMRLPPLRHRKEDIYQLARLFLERAGGASFQISPGFWIGLASHDWPLNVRELDAAIHRAVALADGALDESHLPEVEAPESLPAVEVKERAVAPSEEDLRALLVAHAGNVTAIAKALGKDRVQIHRWFRRYDLSPGDFRGG